MAIEEKVNLIKDRYKTAYTVKQQWHPMFQLVGEYVMTRKQNFEVNSQPGEFLTEQLFTSVPVEANRTLSSSIIGNLWPNGGRSVRIARPRNIQDSAEVRKHYDDVTSVIVEVLDDPEAGFPTALDEFMSDNTSFGVSGVWREKTGDLGRPVRFMGLNVKKFAIEEDQYGVVNTLYIDEELTVRHMVERYGMKKVSERTRELYTQGKFQDKVRVLRLIEPRKTGKFGFGNRGMPIASIHIEYQSGVVLKESGFKRQPFTISRFQRAMDEVYGRSPAMFAMPAIIRLNALWEIIFRAAEKQTNPPLYLLDNGSLGSGVVDTSPGGLNVFNMLGAGEKSPIGAIFDVGDIRACYELVDKLVEEISKAFYIDRLLDLNNETRMTLGESQIRERLRGEGMSSVFKRQEAEFFSPIIKGLYEDLFEEGLVGVQRGSAQEKRLIANGVVPIYTPQVVQEAIDKGQQVYTIEYISPANRIMRTEEIQGITTYLDILLGIAQGGIPDVLDNPDTDKIAERIATLTGSDSLSRAATTIQKIRKMRADSIAQQQQVQQAQIAADVGMKTAQAQSMIQGAISGRPKG